MQAADGKSVTTVLKKNISPSELVLIPVERFVTQTPSFFADVELGRWVSPFLPVPCSGWMLATAAV